MLHLPRLHGTFRQDVRRDDPEAGAVVRARLIAEGVTFAALPSMNISR